MTQDAENSLGCKRWFPRSADTLTTTDKPALSGFFFRLRDAGVEPSYQKSTFVQTIVDDTINTCYISPMPNKTASGERIGGHRGGSLTVRPLRFATKTTAGTNREWGSSESG